ncbi:protein disulfide isomerase associated 4, putative, partial [Acanthamoeba castellanii str. Neff]
YEKAATQLARENNPLVFAKVDCTRNKELCDSVQVQGFPTVKLFFHQRMHEYMGPRRAAGIVSYMKKIMTGLTVIVDTAENLATYTQKPPVMVGFFDSIDSQESLEFERASLIEDAVEFTFVHVVNASLVEGLGQKVNTVVMYRQGGGQATYSGEFDGNEIARFAAGHAHPYFMNAARSWDRLIVERKVKHIVLVAADVANAEEWQPLRQVFTKLAEEYAVKDTGFVFVNHAMLTQEALYSKQQYSFAVKLGHSGEFYPAVLVMHPEDERVFVVPEETEMTEDSMRDYIEGVRNGSIKGKPKSAEEPENNDGPVKVVVGTTFDDLVIDNDNDVLVKFYAPWCGHCKDLIPIYEEVAARFANEEEVVIAEFDSTENDQARVTIKGFPTIYLFPADHKDEPIKFEGDRTAEAFDDFLYQHATCVLRTSTPLLQTLFYCSNLLSYRRSLLTLSLSTSNLAGKVRPQREAPLAHPTLPDEL